MTEVNGENKHRYEIRGLFSRKPPPSPEKAFVYEDYYY